MRRAAAHPLRGPLALLVLAIAMHAFPGHALAAKAENQTGGLFDSTETLEITLTGPWRDLVHTEAPGVVYPATIEYRDAEGRKVLLAVSAERRGFSRQELCRIPPLLLRLEDGAAAGTPFEGQEVLHMATHCREKSRFEQYYVLEMLAYRIYNLVTDKSLRVRPLSVTYREAGEADSNSFFKRKSVVGPEFAFFTEDTGALARRLGLSEVRVDSIRPSQLDPGETALMALFQYAIGNTDWSALRGHKGSNCCHNIQPIGADHLASGETLLAIPYDFDFSGLVDADYAAPPAGLPIRDVTQRLYRGYCVHSDAHETARQKFLSKEEEIYRLVKAEVGLDSRTRDRAVLYLESFFEILENETHFREKIVEKCRG